MIDSLTTLMIYFFLPVSYLLVGFVIMYYTREAFKKHMLENMVSPMWQNYVFVMILLIWPFFLFLVVTTTILKLFKAVVN
ncbi:hypothetical protein [His 1 virus]|uniref:Putative transmembrane protein ORF17 n=1 Tax=His1 virus (isolate Australia/Victoria) TaxID=654912 RepID=Y017_HIS1I|nr:hypothetical protein His1V_gp17 [His 1 virus]Q25BH8.1 RecName: Full=Putative transmembrane protein ORF17 [His1 virus (isolate Victoria)]AAQ13732.1 hypothetical protein [His 1 virus]